MPISRKIFPSVPWPDMRTPGCTSSSTTRLTLLRVLSATFIAVAYVIAVPMRNLSDTEIEAVSSNPAPVCSGATCTITFTYTGDYYAWEVPAGTTSVTFDVRGASGGDGQYPGGNGGKVTGTLNVTGIASLFVYVGGQGGVSTTSGVAATGGWNGGANSGASNNTLVRGGGGGASGSDGNGAAGGSGVVIVSSNYTAIYVKGSPTVTLSGGKVIYTFTASGAIMF